jgi:putative intracellular protease/amidase
VARILCPVPDRDFDTTEVAVPWHVLTRAGHEVVFATERGGAAPACDPRLLTGVIFGQLGAAPDAQALYARLVEDAAFRAPIAWSAIEPADYQALLLPGGHAPGMRQYLGSAELQAKVAAFWALDPPHGRPVGAICHGVLVLARAIHPVSGRSVLHASRTTCLPKYMERTAFFLTAWRLGRYYRTYPAYVEDEVRAALDDPRQLVDGPRELTARGTDENDTPAWIVEDGRYVSARWPGDAWRFGKALLARL